MFTKTKDFFNQLRIRLQAMAAAMLATDKVATPLMIMVLTIAGIFVIGASATVVYFILWRSGVIAFLARGWSAYFNYRENILDERYIPTQEPAEAVVEYQS